MPAELEWHEQGRWLCVRMSRQTTPSSAQTLSCCTSQVLQSCLPLCELVLHTFDTLAHHTHHTLAVAEAAESTTTKEQERQKAHGCAICRANILKHTLQRHVTWRYARKLDPYSETEVRIRSPGFRFSPPNTWQGTTKAELNMCDTFQWWKMQWLQIKQARGCRHSLDAAAQDVSSYSEVSTILRCRIVQQHQLALHCCIVVYSSNCASRPEPMPWHSSKASGRASAPSQ